MGDRPAAGHDSRVMPKDRPGDSVRRHSTRQKGHFLICPLFVFLAISSLVCGYLRRTVVLVEPDCCPCCLIKGRGCHKTRIVLKHKTAASIRRRLDRINKFCFCARLALILDKLGCVSTNSNKFCFCARLALIFTIFAHKIP